MLFSTFSESGVWEATTEFATLTTCLLSFPLWELHVDLFVRLSMVLEHLPERVTPAHTINVEEGNLTGDTLSSVHSRLRRWLSVDERILFCCSRMLSDGDFIHLALPHTVTLGSIVFASTRAIVDELVSHR